MESQKVCNCDNKSIAGYIQDILGSTPSWWHPGVHRVLASLQAATWTQKIVSHILNWNVFVYFETLYSVHFMVLKYTVEPLITDTAGEFQFCPL
jgi:hypothetical protein